MSLRLEAITFDARDPAGPAAFWAALLGREVVTETRGALLPGDETQVGLRFVMATRDEVSARRLHLHLTSTSPEDQQQTVERALHLGGRHLDVGQRPEEEHIVLADPGGNELCVIEPGNRFLAGCGLLGEVTCDGGREVGSFWRDALGWPLVWDDAGQTAVQSPLGGTKIAWAGPPVSPKAGRNTQWFDLVASDPAAEVARLITLGATRLAGPVGDSDGDSDGDPAGGPDGVELTDPEGNELRVRTAQAPTAARSRAA